MADRTHIIVVRQGKTTLILSIVVALLVIASVAGQAIKLEGGHDYAWGFVPQFCLDNEGNVPTYFSSVLLLLCACTLGTIAVAQKVGAGWYVRHWALLAVIFLLMSIDEAAGLHELLIDPIRRAYHLGGAFNFAWVIPGAIFCLYLAVHYWKFLLYLPLRTRTLVCVAAGLYVGGAIGLEMLGGWYAESHGSENWPYTIIATSEETLEMVGLVVFIHALLGYVRTKLKEIRLVVEEQVDGQP